MANNIIDSIQLSGVTYGIKGSGGTETIELTQAQYDALVDKDPNTFYVITDAQAGDLTNYYTKTETNNAITAATSTKQDTLVSGTNIKTINNESILGSGNIDIQGGGKAVTGGTNISVTTGETADTINCTLPITINSNKTTILPNNASNTGNGSYNFVGGNNCKITNYAGGSYPSYAFCYGYNNTVTTEGETAFGRYNQTRDASGAQYYSGTSIFTIGNGDWTSRRHNALEVMFGGDIYIANTDDTSTANWYQKPMVRLQDTITATAANTTALGGLSLVKLTQTEYDALATKDSNTLYIIIN